MSSEQDQPAPSGQHQAAEYAMGAKLWSLLRTVVLALLPYLDPIQRARVRRAAHGLVGSGPLPPPDAQVGSDAARLAVLRLLYLQRRCRRAQRHGDSESAIFFARSSVETCLLGLYSLYKEDIIADMRKASVQTMVKLMRYVVEDKIMPEDLMRRTIASLGEGKQLPSAKAMADFVGTRPGGWDIRSLYYRYYDPTSALYVHANPATLMRHVRPDGRFRRRPAAAWTARSALHTADACIGILAATLSSQRGCDPSLFNRYADAHMKRTLTPLFIVGSQGIRRGQGSIANLLLSLSRVKRILRYCVSERALADTVQEREAYLGDEFGHAFRFLRSDPDLDAAVDIWCEFLVETCLNGIAARVDERPTAVARDGER